MDDHNAHRPTVGAVDRADDRAAGRIATESTEHPDAVTADPFAASALRWHRIGVTLRQVAVDLALLADELDAADEGGAR